MKKLILTLSFLSLMNCCSKKIDKPIKITVTVDSVTYEKDKKQIADCFVENVEYYRQRPEILAHDFFESYSICFNLKEDKYQRISYPAKEAVEVTTDAVLYSENKLFCFAFLVIKGKYKNNEKDIEEKMRKGREYDARAVIGYRKRKEDPFRIYPVKEFSVIGYEGYKPAVETLKQLYFTKLSYVGGGAGTHYEGLQLKNVGEKDFFEKSPYFKKTKDGLYYFQLYMDTGKIYENYTCKCEN